MNENKPILEIKNLHTCFHTMDGVVNAVDGVDFKVMPGEILGLVGESGCGKSVTAMSILRLLRCPPAEIKGEVLFEGQNLLKLDKDSIRKIRGNAISMIFQEPMTALNPVLTVGEQIAESVRLHEGLSQQKAWEKAVRMLTRVQISEPEARAAEYPHKLSGGMRQRAMIAMALALNPRLLFADEPTTALDVTIQAQIMELMLKLQKETGSSIVLITHDLGLIAETVQRVVVMYGGKVVEEALVKDLFYEPLHPYTQGLLGSVPVIGRKATMGRNLDEIPGMVPHPLAMPKGCTFNPRCKKAMDICRREKPPMVKPAPGRRVACWLHTGKEEMNSVTSGQGGK
ncbi:ABC transporter ATP-binding protein [Dethiosulfatarculus sandiegensis]|uniref:Peptide ABC transporter ATP-binding protein n=1 Tax=Dethiosulfatarculus sandiegensis TaxID=1429043 RepID=A0A0D2HSW6_9BACT|nr:ABC transporter ATP-binding protein [Dethiosulfatarculus sandiegensis]KIX13633.1 peptide ABC transporter ATP-binding protein [Dethiosulfatarculus sandiegensis]